MSFQRQLPVPRKISLQWTHHSRMGWMVRRPVRALLAPPVRTSPINPDAELSPRQEDWRMEDHWTAVTSYMADLYFPNEG